MSPKDFWQGGLGGGLGGAAIGPRLRLGRVPLANKLLGGVSVGTGLGMISSGVTLEALRTIDPYNGICARPDKKN